MKDYVAVSGLSLSPNNIKKMHKHMGTIIKPVTGGEMEIFVSPMKAKKLMNAMRKGKGMKLVMTPAEMEHTMKHGKGVVLPSRKIFRAPKEGMPIIAKKGVIAHQAPVDSVPVGNDTFQVLSTDPAAPAAPEAPAAPKKRGRKPKTEGGRIRNIKDIGRAIKKGFKKVSNDYKEFRDDPKNAMARKIIQEGAKQAIKTAIVSGATALGSSVGVPQAGVAAAAVADPIAKMAVQKIGLGQKFMLNDNYNNFLNPMHPAMSPALPPPDNSTMRGSGFRSAGYGMHGGSFKSPGYSGRLRSGTGVINNIQPIGSALNPMLPQGDNSLPR